MSPEYSLKEERLNILTHGLGLVMSLIGLVLLLVYSILKGDVWHITSFSIYGASLVIMYLASTLYHNASTPKWRNRLQLLDHSAIYVLIAGTYTPFLLVTLREDWGWWLFGIIWGLAVIGVLIKFFFINRADKLSVALYISMGWMIVFAIQPLMEHLPVHGFYWLVAGGIIYTIGAVLYMLEKLPYNHALFHVLVLAGSFCHFIAVYFYVL